MYQPCGLPRCGLRKTAPARGCAVVEPVDAVFQPVRADRVCVGIEQHDVRVACRAHPGLGRLPVLMAAAEPAVLAQQPDVGLRPRPGSRSIPAALVHDDDLVVPLANSLTHALDQQPGEEQSVACDGDDADRTQLHALCVARHGCAERSRRHGADAGAQRRPIPGSRRGQHPDAIPANFEFIVCDDGSTDDTPRELARYAARDPRIRVLTLPQLGLVAALNRGHAGGARRLGGANGRR